MSGLKPGPISEAEATATAEAEAEAKATATAEAEAEAKATATARTRQRQEQEQRQRQIQGSFDSALRAPLRMTTKCEQLKEERPSDVNDDEAVAKMATSH
jgi:hypothetical protein